MEAKHVKGWSFSFPGLYGKLWKGVCAWIGEERTFLVEENGLHKRGTKKKVAKRGGRLYKAVPMRFLRGLARPLLLASLPVSLLLCGCPSVGVHPLDGADTSKGSGPGTVVAAQAAKPNILYVSPFGFERCALNVDREGAELELFKSDIAKAFAADVAERLVNIEAGPSCNILAAGKPPRVPQAAWWVTGRFTRINQGSRALRAFVGMGSGGTKFETEVEVYDLASSGMKPLFSFVTSGGSGAATGALVGITPLTMPLSAAVDSRAGLSDDRARTARMIAAYVSEQLAACGAIPWSSVKEAKRLDEADSTGVTGDAPPAEEGMSGPSPTHAASGTKRR